MQSNLSRLQDSQLRQIQVLYRTAGCLPSVRNLYHRHEALPLQRASVQGRAASFLREGESWEDEPLHMSVPMGFEAEALEASKAADMEEGIQYYAELKQHMLARTRRFGSLLAAYLLLQVSGPAALATLIGTAGSWVYLKLLMDDMDNVSESTVAPFRQAEAQPQGPARLVLRGVAAYRQALKPRLLVPVALAAGMGLYNSQAQQPLGGAAEFSLLAGFLSYKAALLLEFWDSAKPKFDPESLGRQPRPQLPVLPDVEPVQIRAMKGTDQSASQ